MRFKVEFCKNQTIKAIQPDTTLSASSIDFDEVEGNMVISSLVVNADTERQAADTANEMATHIYSELLVGR